MKPPELSGKRPAAHEKDAGTPTKHPEACFKHGGLHGKRPELHGNQPELHRNLSDTPKRAPVSQNALGLFKVDTVWTLLAYTVGSAAVSAAAARRWIRLYCLDFDP